MANLLGATDYYVAKTGDDANDGSEGSPFLTISKAASVLVAGDVCYIKTGVYREVVNPANGGTAAAPITFKAFGEDEVTISATEVITDWQMHRVGTFKASVNMDLGRQTMLFFEQEAMDIARWPNNIDQDPFTIDAMTVENGTASTVIASDLPDDLDLTGAYLWYLGAHSGAMDVWLNGRIQTGNRVWNNYADGGMWKGQSEENNLIDPMDQFRDLANLDFRPANDSELVNAGKFIEGITTEVSGWAPDIGAYERGLERWVPGAPRADGVVTAINPFLASRVRAQISPNPTNGLSMLNYTSTVSGKLDWLVVSADGRVLQSGQQLQRTAGEQQLELDLRKLPAGPYVVIGRTTEGGFAERIVVQ